MNQFEAGLELSVPGPGRGSLEHLPSQGDCELRILVEGFVNVDTEASLLGLTSQSKRSAPVWPLRWGLSNRTAIAYQDHTCWVKGIPREMR